MYSYIQLWLSLTGCLDWLNKSDQADRPNWRPLWNPPVHHHSTIAFKGEHDIDTFDTPYWLSICDQLVPTISRVYKPYMNIWIYFLIRWQKKKILDSFWSDRNTIVKTIYSKSVALKITLRKLNLRFLSHWKEYDLNNSFPFDHEPNGITFGS